MKRLFQTILAIMLVAPLTFAQWELQTIDNSGFAGVNTDIVYEAISYPPSRDSKEEDDDISDDIPDGFYPNNQVHINRGVFASSLHDQDIICEKPFRVEFRIRNNSDQSITFNRITAGIARGNEHQFDLSYELNREIPGQGGDWTYNRVFGSAPNPGRYQAYANCEINDQWYKFRAVGRDNFNPSEFWIWEGARVRVVDNIDDEEAVELIQFGDILVDGFGRRDIYFTTIAPGDLTTEVTATIIGPNRNDFRLRYNRDEEFNLTRDNNRHIWLTFRPTEEGEREATLRFECSNLGRWHNEDRVIEISLRGEGFDGQGQPNIHAPAQCIFGNVNQGDHVDRNVTVTNRGADNSILSISEIELAGSDDDQYQIRSISGPDGDDEVPIVLNADEDELIVTVRFLPDENGLTNDAFLRFTNNDPDEVDRLKSVSLFGTGIDNDPNIVFDIGGLDFVDVLVDDSGEMEFVMRNASNTSRYIESIVPVDRENFPEGADYFYRYFPNDNSFPLRMMSGSERTIRVSFDPEERREYDAWLRIVVREADDPIYLPLHGRGVAPVIEFDIPIDETLNFGEVNIGEEEIRIITISNEGDFGLRIDLVELPGYFFSNFEEDITIEPLDEDQLTIFFRPQREGVFNEGDLRIRYWDADNDDAHEVNISLSGTGIEPQREEIEANGNGDYNRAIENNGNEELHFNSEVALVAEPERDLTIRNVRRTSHWRKTDSPIRDDEISWLDWNPKTDIIPANDEIDVTITIDVDDLIPGYYEADINFNNLSNDIWIATVNVQLDVQNHPEIELAPVSMEFDPTYINDTSNLILFISNGGNIDLTVSEVTIEGNNFSSDFMEELTLEPDEEIEVSVVFEPEESGEFDGTLTITSNDPDGEREVPLSGTGVEIVGRELTFSLTEGWNMISINIRPTNEDLWAREEGPHVIRMLEHLRIDEHNHHVILIKNLVGQFYNPEYGYNSIPYWNLLEGYLIKVDEALETTWSGEAIPPDTDIPLTENWNMISYLPTYELDASSPDFHVLSPILDNLIIAKDLLGRFINPEYRYSNMPPWRETQGYLVKVDADVTLNYPEPQENVNFISVTREEDLSSTHWTEPQITDNNMSVLINSIANVKSGQINQVVALNTERNVVGFGRIESDGLCGLAIWGDDESTEEVEGLKESESFELRTWDEINKIEKLISPKTVLSGKGLIYSSNEMTVIDAVAVRPLPDDYYLSQNYPNPFNSVTKLNYGVPLASTISVKVYDIRGRMVATLMNGHQSAGHHYAIWDAGSASSGLYIVRMEAEGFSKAQKLVLTK